MAMTSRTPAARIRPSSSLHLGPEETAHVGVDVHKATYHVAVCTDRRGLVASWVQPADPGLLVAKLLPPRARIAQVVYEAGPTGFTLVRRLRADGFRAEVIAPSKTLTTPGPEPKTDRLDGRRLATFAQKGLLTPVRVPTEQEEADRQVLRTREQLVRKSRSAQQQIKAFLLQHGAMSNTRTSPGARPSSSLSVDQGETAHVGVDVHKATYHVAVCTDRRGLVCTWVQPAD